MEEILASIRRIIADDQEGARVAANVAPPPPPPPPEPDDILDLADLGPTMPAARLELEREDVSFRDSEGQIDFDAIGADEEEYEEVAPPPPLVEAARPRPAPAPEPLLSSAADTSVAQAFSMLSTTVLSSNPRTLEDLVKEMLRPMLKTWLDENLPPLVERLVQAEIQRVTRGGR
jgi:cell pole-organizing protein PopZ